MRAVLHLRQFHADNDYYGMSPLEAAASAIDLSNTAIRWNKALLENSARPSGALVYTARDGNLSAEQYERLKSELESGFQGSANAGRPLLLEGGLDWKSMSLSPKDMDFMEARHTAAREIALALGVPPMLLGIPGDNTYSNLAEAQRIFWRQTVLPLVERTAKALAHWLAPAFDQPLDLRSDLDQLPALSIEREALWSSLEKITFLTDDEKRAAVGYGPKGEAVQPTTKFNPHHDHLGRFTNAPDGEGDGDGGLVLPIAKKPTPTKKPGEKPPERKPKPGQSGKDGSKDIPDWVRQGGERPRVGEDGKSFAKRLLDEKYGIDNYDNGSSSEFSQIQKWVDRHFDCNSTK